MFVFLLTTTYFDHRYPATREASAARSASAAAGRAVEKKRVSAKRAPRCVVSVSAVTSGARDQVNHVVPARQVDDLDEAHQLDPTHQ